jgi:hypothetical protein
MHLTDLANSGGFAAPTRAQLLKHLSLGTDASEPTGIDEELELEEVPPAYSRTEGDLLLGYAPLSLCGHDISRRGLKQQTGYALDSYANLLNLSDVVMFPNGTLLVSPTSFDTAEVSARYGGILSSTFF